ncbi:hypothetical protein Tco_1420058 [Tanacetum coccineum]
MGQSFNGDVNEMQGYLFVNLAKKIKNIDGKVLKKDAPRMAVRGVRIDKDKVIASPSLEQVVSPFKLVSFAEQVCITPMKDYQMETDDPPLKSVSIDENNSSDYGTNQLSVHIGDVNGFLILKEADPKVKAFANVVKGANGAANNDNTKKKINIRTLISEDKVENSDFVFFLPIAAFQIVKCLLIHLWFFRGNGICVSLGPIYVSRAWKEFGFQKIMRDDDGFFYFKFESNKGMEQFLNKEISSQIGRPIMVDSFTSETSITLALDTNLPLRYQGNRIMNLIEYNTFRANPSKSLSQTYTRYKTFLNELSSDGVKLSKHEINVGFINNLLEKWLSFSQGLRNANHTQTLDRADIYGRFDFQKNSDDEVDERTSEEYLRDLDIEFHERDLLSGSKDFIKFVDMALPPRDQRHQYLRFEGLKYTDADITDFEDRLGRFYSRGIHRMLVLDFESLPAVMSERLTSKMLMEHRDDQGQSVFTSRAWRRLFEVAEGAPDVDEGDQVVLAPVLAPHPPLVAGPTRTMEQRLGRLEEDVYGLRGALGEQRDVLDSMARDFSQFTTWTVTRLSRMMDQGG